MSKEVNTKIAKFLGWKYIKDGDIWSKPNHDPALPDQLVFTSRLNFHDDWNELMTVVEYIEKLGLIVYIKSNHCIIQAPGKIKNEFAPRTYAEAYGKNKKDAVLNALYTFTAAYSIEQIEF